MFLHSFISHRKFMFGSPTIELQLMRPSDKNVWRPLPYRDVFHLHTKSLW